jgi:hypothetical protein
MPGLQGHGSGEEVEDVAAPCPGLPVVAVVMLHEQLPGTLDLAPAAILVMRNAMKPAKSTITTIDPFAANPNQPWVTGKL